MSIEQWHRDTLGQRTVEALKKNEFDAVYFSNRAEAVEHILSFITPEATVGIGGSMTLNALDIPAQAKAKGANVLNHNVPDLTPEARMEILRGQLTSDVFLSSSNAITLDGCLVNIDGVGNRVSAINFGPKKVVLVVGVNKICTDVHAAYRRIGMIASPMNNQRLERPNPCTKTGVCTNCQGPTRICRIYSTIKRKPTLSDITVVIIGEELGY